MSKIKTAKEIFDEWLHKNCKKGEIMEIRSSHKVFVAMKNPVLYRGYTWKQKLKVAKKKDKK